MTTITNGNRRLSMKTGTHAAAKGSASVQIIFSKKERIRR
jgi:hypothetical protein